MEIERKWLVDGLPQGMVPCRVYQMEQGYLTVSPVVRIRSERDTATDGRTHYILCLKGEGGLVRQEIELPLSAQQFADIKAMIARPLIPKTRWDHQLADGLVLEVNQVDAGNPGCFWYAEVEFATREQALAWQPSAAGLGNYLCNEVTGLPGQSMSAYWAQTRLEAAAAPDAGKCAQPAGV